MQFFAVPIVSKCALLENSFDAPKNSNSKENDIWGLEKRCQQVPTGGGILYRHLLW